MRGVLDDLLRHHEEMRIIHEKCLVQVWDEAHGGENQCGPRAPEHRVAENGRSPRRSFEVPVFMLISASFVPCFASPLVSVG